VVKEEATVTLPKIDILTILILASGFSHGDQIATPFSSYVAAVRAQASTGLASAARQMAGEHHCMIAAITYAVPAAIVSLSVWRAGDDDEFTEAMIDEIHTCNNALQTMSYNKH